MSANIPWWAPAVGAREYELLRQVLDTNYLNEGEVTTRLEQRIADLLGVRHAVATTSGTAAIFLALAAVGVGADDEVIVPDVTFIATANAVMLTGARPVLVDIDRETLNIDPREVERAITRRTKAIVPVHVSGRAAAMTELLAIGREHGLAVIEDSAEAFLSCHQGRMLGTYGQAGCFSFSPNKTITTGQGGLVVTDDDRLHARLRELKDHGRPTRGTGGNDIHHSVGYNFKLTNVQAAIGLGQLELLQDRLSRQRCLYRRYAAGLADLDGIRLMPFRVDEGETPQWSDALADRRDDLERFLAARGIGSRPFWFPIHTQAPYRLSDDRFPNSTELMRQAIWLPSAFSLTDEDVETVCHSVREFYGRSR